jgi:electron-transferring-flavoprotein dehydrogenase
MADRETLEVDVLIVGGGPAGMGAALRLAQLQKEKGGEPLAIAVLEKAREAGAHMLSGALLDPRSLRELVPDFKEKGAPLASEVHEDRIYFLTERNRFKFPITPPPFTNHGNYVTSLNRFVKWLASLVEAEGIDIFTGFAATEMLFDGNRVVGVRTGDRGIGKHGEKKSTFEPGVDISAKVTILAEGVRGNLTKTLVRRLKLDEGKQPQVYAIGIKELWEVPKDRIGPGVVMHTMGYPLKNEEFGGGFIYSMPDGLLSVGFVAGLDYKDPLFDPHVAFQKFKLHPMVRELLDGGQMSRYGAKALPEAGWHAIPRTWMDGALIVGDAGGFLNSFRLKGVHLALKTGMLAAETAFDAVRAGDVSASKLQAFETKVNNSDVRKELYAVRNVHQSFSHGLYSGIAYSAVSFVTNGWWITDPMPSHAGHERLTTIKEYYNGPSTGSGPSRAESRDGQPPSPEAAGAPVKIDRKLTFDRLTNVHYSGTRHAEDQPSHLIVHDTDICRTRCRVEFGNPCTRFCPAHVYEMVDDGQGGKKLQINASNCVHCKTCDIMDPYQIIDWIPPEGGGGPQYDGM